MELDFTEKNKSAHKLQNFGPIYCINLDDEVDRWSWMEQQFKYWQVKNYERVSAYDGRDDDLGTILRGTYPDMMSSGEVGCTTSHLKAIKHYLETSDSPYAVIMEDDCDLSVVKHWNFTWSEFIAYFPYDWDVVQMAIICTGDLHIKLHKRFVNDFSTACYVINRHHAEKLIRLHCRDGKYKIDQGVKPRAVADDLIYNSGNAYAIPLLMYKVEFPSAIHQDHVDVFHQNNHVAIWNWWQQRGSDMSIQELMDYDPYLGRVTNPSNGNG